MFWDMRHLEAMIRLQMAAEMMSENERVKRMNETQARAAPAPAHTGPTLDLDPTDWKRHD